MASDLDAMEAFPPGLVVSGVIYTSNDPRVGIAGAARRGLARPPASGGIRSAFLAEDFSATAHTPYLIAAIGVVGSYGKQINTFRQRLDDSYFWVVTQFSKTEVATAYKAQTVATLIQGLTGMTVVAALSWVIL